MWQSKKKIRIRLKGFDYQLVDSSAAKIVEVVTRTGARVSALFRCQPRKR